MIILLLRLWLATLRIQRPPLPNHPVLLGHWHQDILVAVAAYRGTGLAGMVSASQDGDLAAGVMAALGYKVVRGSSSNRQTALRSVLQALREGPGAGAALDGPRGPAMKAKPGAQWLANRSGAPFYLLRMHYGRHFRLSSWDRMVVPLPFTRVRVEWMCEGQENHP